MVDLDALAAVFRDYPDVHAVYLFGSAAEGQMREGSDIDLAVVPRSGSCRERRLEMLADLTRAGFDRVDVVFLDTDDLVLKYEAVRQNCVVYQAPDFDRGETYSKVVRMYLDFLPYLEVQRKAYKRRILHGQD
jgi:predicted nucleotidyltransferase